MGDDRGAYIAIRDTVAAAKGLPVFGSKPVSLCGVLSTSSRLSPTCMSSGELQHFLISGARHTI